MDIKERYYRIEIEKTKKKCMNESIKNSIAIVILPVIGLTIAVFRFAPLWIILGSGGIYYLSKTLYKRNVDNCIEKTKDNIAIKIFESTNWQENIGGKNEW